MKLTIKQILTSNGNWWRFYEKHQDTLRPAIPICIVKLLSCKNNIRGYQEYCCSNPTCSHTKRVPFTCKCKACSSCGKKATELWINKQHQLLPKTSWQHITFTMPSELWDFFWCNRYLLNHIAKCAADCLKAIAAKKKIILGIFIAIHTFGRSLNRNVHIHVSVTTGGLAEELTRWKNLFFKKTMLMPIWRYNVITLLRKAHRQKPLIIPKAIQEQVSPLFTFNHFLDKLYKKNWIVDCAKPSTDHKHNVTYLGGYVKRPPIAESKLRHYDGHEVTFSYLDHTTKTRKKMTLSCEEFIGRFVQHIPDNNFRMIRYYGFLANRVRGQLLPLVYQLLGQKIEDGQPPTYADLMQNSFGFNPLICILCGSFLVLRSVHFGQSSVHQLLQYHRELALLKKIPV
jgi:hypothetical protein